MVHSAFILDIKRSAFPDLIPSIEISLPSAPKSGNYAHLTYHQKRKREKIHTTAGIRWWSPTQLLICRSEACVWQSGRDAQFSSVYGRMYQLFDCFNPYTHCMPFYGKHIAIHLSAQTHTHKRLLALQCNVIAPENNMQTQFVIL